MTKYEEIIAHLRLSSPEKAELMEEEIDIIIHKLKFLPADSFPTLIVLNEKGNFEPTYNELLAEKVKISGGRLTNSFTDNPSIIVILQSSAALYQVLPDYLATLKAEKIRALLENKVYIIPEEHLQDVNARYLRDIEILAEILQPKYLFFGRDAEDWVKFELL